MLTTTRVNRNTTRIKAGITYCFRIVLIVLRYRNLSQHTLAYPQIRLANTGLECSSIEPHISPRRWFQRKGSLFPYQADSRV